MMSDPKANSTVDHHTLNQSIISYLDLFDEYETQRSLLVSHLKAAFFALAQARYASGRKLGPADYDYRMKALRKVRWSDGKWTFLHTRQTILIENAKNGTDESRALRSGDEKDETDNECSGTERDNDSCDQIDPLRWFGVLLPPSLRDAQVDFRNALEDALVLLNTIHGIETKEQDIRRMIATQDMK